MAIKNELNYSPTQYNTLVGGANNTITNISPGTVGQVLTSNGASSNPSYQTIPSGSSSFTYSIIMTSAASVADATTYYFINAASITSSSTASFASSRFYIPIACTLSQCVGVFTQTAGSAENNTFKLVLNNTTDLIINSTLKLNVASVNVTQSFTQSLVPGDFLQFALVCPTYVTNPNNVRYSGTLSFTV